MTTNWIDKLNLTGRNDEKESAVFDYTAIREPPCINCTFWKPQRLFTYIKGVGMEFDKVRCCHAEEMNHDFSCFSERKK